MSDNNFNKNNDSKLNKEKFSLRKYKQLIDNADDFFEAARRCSFDESVKLKKYPLLIPNFTNRAFACELYLKATLYLNEIPIEKEHKLDNLFLKLSEKVQKEIYDIWRTLAGENIQDCDYVKCMFYDNLEANSNVFARFRYAHEWSGASISLQSSFTEDQMHLHSVSVSRPIGSPTIHDGFLDQFAKAIKKYHNESNKWVNNL